jgi:hypothetical protein
MPPLFQDHKLKEEESTSHSDAVGEAVTGILFLPCLIAALQGLQTFTF